VLAELERQLPDISDTGWRHFRLSDFSDVIGGTGTGAIIAAGLASGMSVEQMTGSFREFGAAGFSRYMPLFPCGSRACQPPLTAGCRK
jgi:uncharacterized protein